MGTFKVEIDKWVAETEERLLAVTRAAVQDIVEEAQTPVGKGGKMRVDTGFLRASGMSGINSMPIGPDKRLVDKPGAYPSPDRYSADSKVSINLANIKYGDTFYFGWTAEYALAREAYDGFLDSALQNWQAHVTKRANELKNRSGK